MLIQCYKQDASTGAGQDRLPGQINDLWVTAKEQFLSNLLKCPKTPPSCDSDLFLVAGADQDRLPGQTNDLWVTANEQFLKNLLKSPKRKKATIF